eukprot:2248337-Prymnesium_polylepis.2
MKAFLTSTTSSNILEQRFHRCEQSVHTSSRHHHACAVRRVRRRPGPTWAKPRDAARRAAQGWCVHLRVTPLKSFEIAMTKIAVCVATAVPPAAIVWCRLPQSCAIGRGERNCDLTAIAFAPCSYSSPVQLHVPPLPTHFCFESRMSHHKHPAHRWHPRGQPARVGEALGLSPGLTALTARADSA